MTFSTGTFESTITGNRRSLDCKRIEGIIIYIGKKKSASFVYSNMIPTRTRVDGRDNSFIFRLDK